ncbi:hypothetical protein ACHAPQ_009221 [Fusarium lateritium]
MQDWAFTNGGIAYDTGKPDRPRNQVVRVKLTSDLSSRVATNPSEGNLDTAISKLEFSERETNYDEPRRAEIDELVIVVGECFEKTEQDCVSLVSIDKPAVTRFDDFDKEQHMFIDTRETALVVRMLKDKMATLYVLKNKADGLCEVQQLGSIKRTCKFIAWYPEFVTGNRSPLREKQRKNVRDAIQRLRDELYEARTESLMPQAPAPHDQNDADENVNGNDDGVEFDDSDNSSATMDYDDRDDLEYHDDSNDPDVGP